LRVFALRPTPKTASPTSRVSSHLLLTAAGLGLVTFLLFAHAGSNGFVMLDDGRYVTENPHVQAGLARASLQWALTTFYAGNWHPLTWISHAIDCQIFGMNPRGPHLENAGIHAISTSLLFATLILSTGRRWPSLFCAALFGWHPLRVESVAWIAERKDVLSMLFFQITLLAYLRYARRPAALAYTCVFLSMALGLLAGPILVMTPVLLLLLDYWPLKRLGSTASLRPLLVEKIPLFVLSITASSITIIAQHTGSAVAGLEEQFTLYARLNNAAVSALAYAAALVYPVHLAPFYPFPLHQSVWRFLAAGLLLVLITAMCVRQHRRRPYLLVGWLWFIASLLPVIGLLQVGTASMADRYSYVPSIGLLVAVVWSFSDWYEHSKSARQPLIVIGICYALALIRLTHRQIGYWKDDVALFSHAAAVTKGNWLAEQDLAAALASRGDLDEAETHIRASLRILPHSVAAEDVLAQLERRAAQRLPGEAAYAQELRVHPSEPLPQYNWANLLLRGGRAEEAITHYRLYLEARPDDPRAHHNYAIALVAVGNLPEAAGEFARTIALNPGDADALCGLGTVLMRQSKFAQAAARFEQALQLNPAMSRAQAGLQQCLSKS
jgi:tetratricopeptide (TPR) repeat protein